MKNNITWFDIPVTDLDRAMRFYSAVLDSPVKKEKTGSMRIEDSQEHHQAMSRGGAPA